MIESVVMTKRRAIVAAAAFATLISIAASPLLSQPREAIVFTVRVPAPETHYVEVQASMPTDGRAAIELMMPIWSPGYGVSGVVRSPLHDLRWPRRTLDAGSPVRCD
jgi:hypothetical protein